MGEHRQTILVVDDVAINVDILLEALADDYTVRVAIDGESALRAAEKHLPDLILLDVMMPGMDGFEVCRRLRANEATRDMRVIFLTALSDDADEAEGLALGAVDYVTKPFSPALVKARVRNHLELKRYEDGLEMLVQRRTQELSEAHDRLKALDAAKHAYLDAIAHELRTPATGVLGIAELLLSEMTDPEMQAEYTEIFLWSRNRLVGAMDSVLQLAQLQSGDAGVELAPVDLAAALDKTVTLLRDAFLERDLALHISEAWPRLILGNEMLVQQSMNTLFGVAKRMAIPGTEVVITFAEGMETVAMHITYQCLEMDENLQNTFFDTFSYDRASSLVEDLGLAVPLAAHIVRAMGGSAEIHGTDSGGVIMLVFLKARGEADLLDLRIAEWGGHNP